MSVWWGNCGSPFTPLQVCSCFVEWGSPYVRGSVGDAIYNSLFFLLGGIGWGIILQMFGIWYRCLMWLVWKERNAWTLEYIERPIELLKTSLARTLFEWSRIWGIMHCIFLFDFLISIISAIWFVCILSLSWVYHRKHVAFLLLIKLLLPIKNKRKSFILFICSNRKYSVTFF